MAAVLPALGHGLCCMGREEEEGSAPMLGPTANWAISRCRWGGSGGTVLWLWTRVPSHLPPSTGHLLQALGEGRGFLNFSPLSPWVNQCVVSLEDLPPA